jgi:pimeloyl-ACP methyl ester carboxylesterase
VPVDEHTFTLGTTGPVHYRSAPAAGVPPLYLHGIPTSSEDWGPFLERSGGIAPDLIGFGRSGKGGHLDYSLDGLASFVAALLEHLGIGRVSLVAHQWGAAAGVLFAARNPERVTRITLLQPLPLIDGWWRRPVLGELLMGATNRRLLARTLRQGSVDRHAWPDQRIAAVWEQFDQGTQRAILRLHRSIDASGLAQVGASLNVLEPPALVLWGEFDPWLEPAFAERYARLIPHAGA